MESAMTQREAYKRYRYRFCGHVFNAWLPAAKRPNDAKLLYHLSQQHPDKIKPYLERMRTEDSGMVVAETYEVVKAWADCHEIAVIHEFVDRLGAPRRWRRVLFWGSAVRPPVEDGHGVDLE
jgi:hypothetical protein